MARQRFPQPVWSEALEKRLLFSGGLPRPDHVVVVVEENHTYDQILGPATPSTLLWPVDLPSPLNQDRYLRNLARRSASMTQMQSVGRPNATTYQSLMSGLNPTPPDHPVPPPPYHAPNLASELIAAGMTFGGYSESLPYVGYRGGNVGGYDRPHNPWVDLANVPRSDNLPFSAFPSNYAKLPTVSFVVPNLYNDMHSANVSRADQWLANNISGYARWAMSHNSLLIVIWDEGFGTSNHIPTLFYGPMVDAGNYSEHISQPNVLRTLEDMYGLAPTGRSVTATPITDIFATGGLADAADAAKRRPLGGHASISGVVSQTPAAGLTLTGKPAAGWWVYLDSNNDGMLEPGERSTRTDRHGHFTFRDLRAGTYTVRVVQRPGYLPTTSATQADTLTLGGTQHVSNVQFSETPIGQA
ncbi:MAG: hypothetical protein JWL69_3962 [Phycisphaerales bacterium]|nr:hypothetical protein [Phycisphaerales bacterium]